MRLRRTLAIPNALSGSIFLRGMSVARIFALSVLSLAIASGVEAQQPSPSPVAQLQKTEDSSTRPAHEYPDAPQPALPVLSWYRNYHVPALAKEEPADLASFIHDGVLTLSLQDAIGLAITNNLDAEVHRYDLSIADMDLLRTKGGGTSRGVSFTVSQMPAGVGPPGTPLLNAAATNVSPTSPTVTSSLFDVSEITEQQTSLSVQGTAPFSSGPPIPAYDAALSGQLAATRIDQNLAAGVTVTPGTQTRFTGTLASLQVLQGFSTGLSLQAGVNNNGSLATGTGGADPFSQPNVVVSLNQPLLRGFGPGVNRREIRVAQNDQKISRLVFRQQLIELVYGISRLYYDLVSLNEDVKVKQDTLAAARKLYDDDATQVQVGTLAPIELMRAKALVASSELDLVRSQGLVEQQEIVLKTQISRTGNANPAIKAVHIRPTSQITIPETEQLPAEDQLVAAAIASRADLAQAALQVSNGEITLEGSRNQTLPQVDLIADVQTRGSLAAASSSGGSTTGNTLGSGATARQARIYEAGIQLELPVRNRVAKSDAARDTMQVRQMQARVQQLRNQVVEEVQDALRAVSISRLAWAAAVQSRQYQEQLLQAEREKLAVGASANFFIVQDQGFLAQARSSEVAARSAYVKAKVALDRAVGTVLENNNVDVEQAIRK